MKRKILGLLLSAALVATMAAGCGNGGSSVGTDSATSAPSSTEAVTLEFTQWWEPELAEGALRGIMDEFEAENAGIKVKLISGPYASTKQQVVAGAAAGTMSDVVGLDGAWVSDFVKQGAIANLTEIMKKNNYEDSQLASQIKLNNATYMIPVVNYVYPVFINKDLMDKAGITKVPVTRTEFREAAKKLTNTKNNVYGWILPLSLEAPNGIQNDVMSWAWASGVSMLKDGKPDLTNAEVKSAIEFVKSVYDDGSVAPGSFTMAEQDKVEEFTNGRVGMMVDSLAHIKTIRKSNPNLNFVVTALPAKDGYTGKRGMPYASWGIGIAENSRHQDESWKLVSFLMSEKINSKLSTTANAFPGNVSSKPDFTGTDPLFATAFDIYKAGYPANEFVGLPVAEQLMRSFDEQFQLLLDNKQNIDDTLKKAQAEWEKNF
ncbi:ABC transporter substrate-binding protein [Ruminiclostridium cellobioparum]|uniref:ABC-type sugar transport system, periplasmic component n=1 Tax=Ruminiclostridium cellobioparum subsp. termitidis CT1112 TaxID=1195236 RepID=S0FPA2_RUMCE|nr:sugar ABC transporter substrate-binding protein [Ruminiclostridium cellobioparum]EMS70283.1 ABC-type sugar transport system, periplasmic component [Ruminiclostridium cellobioparum subsp. termitidis CT1112]